MKTNLLSALTLSTALIATALVAPSQAAVLNGPGTASYTNPLNTGATFIPVLPGPIQAGTDFSVKFPALEPASSGAGSGQFLNATAAQNSAINFSFIPGTNTNINAGGVTVASSIYNITPATDVFDLTRTDGSVVKVDILPGGSGSGIDINNGISVSANSIPVQYDEPDGSTLYGYLSLATNNNPLGYTVSFVKTPEPLTTAGAGLALGLAFLVRRKTRSSK